MSCVAYVEPSLQLHTVSNPSQWFCHVCRNTEMILDTFIMGWGRKYVEGYQEKEKLMYEAIEQSLP